MRSQIKLGRIFGIAIGLHYSLLLMVLLMGISLVLRFHQANTSWGMGPLGAMALATGALFFISLLLHELAHSVFAQTHGMPVRQITLFALGGVSQIEKNPSSPRAEFWMAFVGPLTSAVIGMACLGGRRMLDPAGPAAAMLQWLGYINLALAGFNLVPGYPLDGGRVLRAVLWWKSGDRDRATRQAGRAGQVAGLLFIVGGLLQCFAGAGFAGLWLAFIGWFLLQSAGESIAAMVLPQLLQGLTVADVMTPGCTAVDGHLNLQSLVNAEFLRGGDRCFVVEDNTGTAGVITPEEVTRIEQSRWPFTTIYDILRPLDEIPSVRPDTSLKAALEIMGRGDLRQLPVVLGEHVAGVLTRSRLVSFLHKRMQLVS